MNIEDKLLKLECLNDVLFCIQTGIEEGTQVSDSKLSNALYIVNEEMESVIKELSEANAKVIKMA